MRGTLWTPMPTSTIVNTEVRHYEVFMSVPLTRVRKLAELWCDPEYWRTTGCDMDSRDCGEALLRLLKSEAT